MNKRGVLIEIVIVAALLVVGFFWFTHQSGLENGLDNETLGDVLGDKLDDYLEECVPASCCHATECVLKSEAPDCDGMMCTMVCSGPLDCGAGHCEYVDGECEVVSDE